ncbi:MAG: DUF2306 domain-containing protein [Devosia sp.]
MRRRDWLIPLLLMIYAILPLIPGAFRLVELGGGPQLMPENPRVHAMPAPVIVHILTAFFYTVFGAWQFSPTLRRTAWHRRAGRLLAPLGMGAALSGLTMTLLYPTAPEYHPILMPIRLLFGSGMALAIVLALIAIIVHRDVPTHRAWMMRAYAIGLGAATQMFIFIPLAPFGTPEPLTASLMLSAAWVINLAVAEWAIRRAGLVRQVAVPAE